MATTNRLRLATFNVENLFSRAKALNRENQEKAEGILKEVDKLNKLLKKKKYSDADKQTIADMYIALRSYIEICEDRGKLFAKSGGTVRVTADGGDSWDGAIEFRREDFQLQAREFTAKVIKDTKADICCVVEAENRPALEKFNSQMELKFPYTMLIDAFDPRGIDVGLYSKYPLGGVWTHMFEKNGNSRIFSRDCLEVEIQLSDTRKLYFLCNHFKSQGFGNQKDNDKKREAQAKRVAEILGGYNLTRDWVVVAGDFNDSEGRPPLTLDPLLKTANLFDVLALQFPDPADRWTYCYKKKCQQIDFLLVSKPLKSRFLQADVIRKGMFNLAGITNGAQQSYPNLNSPAFAASDHGAVWAEFDLS